MTKGEHSYVRTYVRDKHYIPSTSSLCEGIIKQSTCIHAPWSKGLEICKSDYMRYHRNRQTGFWRSSMNSDGITVFVHPQNLIRTLSSWKIVLMYRKSHNHRTKPANVHVINHFVYEQLVIWRLNSKRHFLLFFFFFFFFFLIAKRRRLTVANA